MSVSKSTHKFSGPRLAEIREEAGLSMKALATRLVLPWQVVSIWESSPAPVSLRAYPAYEPTASQLQDLARELDCHPIDLFHSYEDAPAAGEDDERAAGRASGIRLDGDKLARMRLPPLSVMTRNIDPPKPSPPPPPWDTMWNASSGAVRLHVQQKVPKGGADMPYHNETCGCADCGNYGQSYNPLAIHNQSCGCAACGNYPKRHATPLPRSTVSIEVPLELVPEVRALIAKSRGASSGADGPEPSPAQ